MTTGLRPVDHWSWVAWLTDDTQVREADDRGWADVPADRVMAIELVPVTEGRAPIVLAVPSDARAGFGRRRQLRLSLATETQTFDGSVTILSWQRDGQGLWLHVQDDGRVVVADRPLPLD